ncbi:MAG: TonB-dependent receptor [Gammaproteobacteria bacterium]|nr:TonB-dependent receptor [Gammaproteobacteria bacterium]MCP4089397.1 TonB-dependent receptor [Gammaproteobacteria bacterium]MCP4277512.1 TonB-dependent receptor [Gammaproteobacteria bacterium]MCP4831120.1 TonB-dependent receptor [Gammaproteobacteria bacterium]MCP4928544.1 TonB-dependent receptor [Gammaproteobacteria bacterium]
METARLSTHQKALSINLNDRIYGTLAEIGAAQEVARWLFRVGGAAGSIAKTMSAYDMTVSDEIYGKSGRYVSRERLEAMLDKEYNLLIQRLSKERKGTRFFAFANTITARSYEGTNECHGWVGLRFQDEPGGEPNTIILHVNLLEETTVQQQEAIGILGVNLLYSAMLNPQGPLRGLDNLSDNLNQGELEVDVANLSGLVFADTDPARIGLAMIRSGLAQVILFGRDGNQLPPTEIVHKRPMVIKRTSTRYSTVIDSATFAAAGDHLKNETPNLDVKPLSITEFSINSVHASQGSDIDTNLEHLRELIAQDEWVMLTRLRQSYKLTDYLRRYSHQPIRFVMGISTFAMLLSDKFYVDSTGGILEATGKLYADEVRIYIQSMSEGDFRQHLDSVGLAPDWVTVNAENSNDLASIHNLEFQGPTRLLHRYLMEAGWVEELTSLTQ